MGYCVGGTLLAIALAAMAAWHDERIVSATLLAAQVDFTYAGDLKVFVDEEQVEAVEQRMAERGYLEGKTMVTVFNLLRSNDLIWPYVINNYLRGKAPFPVRPAVLEFRRHAAAGRQSFVLSAQLLSRQQTHERRSDDRQHADRSEIDQGAGLQSRHPGRPHRSGEIGAARLKILRRQGAIRAVRFRPHRRRGQPAVPEENINIGPAASRAAPTSTAGSRRRSNIPAPGGRTGSRWLKKQDPTEAPARVPGDGQLKPIEDAPGSYVKVQA